MAQTRRGWPGLIGACFVASAYVFWAVRFGLHLDDADLNSSAADFFRGLLVITAALFCAALAQAVYAWPRPGALVGVVLASTFGVLVLALAGGTMI